MIDFKMFNRIVKQVRGSLLGLTVTIVHKVELHKDGYGKVLWSAGTSYQGFLAKGQKKVTLADGRDIVPNLVLTIPEPVTISTTDQITLPDGSTPPILAVKPMQIDADGMGPATEIIF